MVTAVSLAEMSGEKNGMSGCCNMVGMSVSMCLLQNRKNTREIRRDIHSELVLRSKRNCVSKS